MTGQPFVSFPDAGRKEGCLPGGDMSDQKNLWCWVLGHSGQNGNGKSIVSRRINKAFFGIENV